MRLYVIGKFVGAPIFGSVFALSSLPGLTL